tara:strand:- start:101 stop:289 length:189 start_codon:yes stop_codon:yes gene_type:complete
MPNKNNKTTKTHRNSKSKIRRVSLKTKPYHGPRVNSGSAPSPIKTAIGLYKSAKKIIKKISS